MSITSSRIVPTEGAFAVDVVNTGALTLSLRGGSLFVAGRISTVPNGSIVLPDSSVSYVEMDDAGTVSSNTTGFTAGRAFLYVVTTSGGKITAIQDWRESRTDALAPNASQTTPIAKTVTGVTDLLPALAATRRVIIVVTVTEVFADGDTSQPTLSIGEESGSASKFAGTAKFTAAALGATFAFAGTLTSGKKVQATSVAAVGTGTGAVSIVVLAG